MSRPFFQFLEKFYLAFEVASPSLVLWYLNCTTFRGVCQEVFENFFRLRATATTVGLTFSNPRPGVLSPPDMIIIPYLLPDCNSQNAQNTGKIMIKICAKYLLTKLLWRGIMVNSGPHERKGPGHYSTFRQFCQEVN